MNDCLILYILHHRACIAGAESTEIPSPDDEYSIYTYYYIQLACHMEAQKTIVKEVAL